MQGVIDRQGKKRKEKKISYMTWETMGRQNIHQEKLELFWK